jgi:hypothetical protein
LLGQGDRDAGAVGRIGEFDAGQPVRVIVIAPIAASN